MWVQAILGDPTALVGHLCDVAQSAGSIHPAAVVMHYSHAPPPVLPLPLPLWPQPSMNRFGFGSGPFVGCLLVWN